MVPSPAEGHRSETNTELPGSETPHDPDIGVLLVTSQVVQCEFVPMFEY